MVELKRYKDNVGIIDERRMRNDRAQEVEWRKRGLLTVLNGGEPGCMIYETTAIDSVIRARMEM